MPLRFLKQWSYFKFFRQWEWKILRKCDACISVVFSNKSQKTKTIVFDRIFTWCKLVILFLVDWNLFSPCYLHSTQPVLHYSCSYCKTVSLYFVYVCLWLCQIWCVVFILRYIIVLFEYLMVFFWYITSFE